MQERLQRLKIGVLAGGPSSEREISLRSGRAVHEALVGEGLNAAFLDIWDDALNAIRINNIDVVFIALHGRFGEDGTVQKILEGLNMPYTGSGVEASRLALDKVASKEIFKRLGLPTPRHAVVEKTAFATSGSWAAQAETLGLPVVVKPQSEGSSIGLSIARKESALKKAMERAFEYGSMVILEEYIEGRELTVGIFEDEPLPVIEIVTRDRVYDYQAKYNDPQTRYIVPARIDGVLRGKAQEIGRAAHKALGCRCFSRVDMMMDSSGRIFVLEVNTIPGMTERSLLPKAAASFGLSFGWMCVKIVEDALERYGSAKEVQKNKAA